MKSINKNAFISIVVALFIMLTICSCSSLIRQKGPKGGWVPLSHENFTKVLNNEIAFTSIQLNYSHMKDTYKSGQSPVLIKIVIGANSGGITKLSMSYIDSFYAYFWMYGDNYKDSSCDEFPIQKVKPIFDFLDSHKSYFFNGNEFSDKDIPFSEDLYFPDDGERQFLNSGKYNFSLIIKRPGDFDHLMWVISKSADKPNDDFQELIDLLENQIANSIGELGE